MTPIFTIGHSRRTQEEFVELLWVHGVSCVVDVRSLPRSRWVPHFNREQMEVWVPEAGVAYRWLPDLGGLRNPRRDAPDSNIRNPRFRAYADYMLTAEFACALEELLAIAVDEQVAIMCAEAVPWKCHRWLISDALVARGYRVEHILSTGERKIHEISLLI
jgi:uncharacterized protein (DUF488 family)